MQNFVRVAITAGVAAIGLGLSTAAHAGTLVEKKVDFRGWWRADASEPIDLGNGLMLTVTAGVHSGGPSANAPLNVVRDAKVTQNAKGLGVKNFPIVDSKELDGSGFPEFLRFTFSEAIDLSSVFFSKADGKDEFDVGIDGIDMHINDTFGSDRIRSFARVPARKGALYKVDFSGGVDLAGDGTNALVPAEGTVFDFYTTDKGDDYRIAKMKIVHEVPEPATALGLLAVGSLAIARGRKRDS